MEIEVNVPESLDEVTLGQYQKYLKIIEDNEDEVFIAQKMIELFCNIELKYVMKMKWNDVMNITKDLASMFEVEPPLKRNFTLDSVNYGFIPNLDEISFGEFVDLDSCLGDWQEMHKAMQILYRPIEIQVRGRYNIKDYDGKLDETMKDMPLSIALGSVFFLLNLGKELSQVMMDYLQRGILKEDLVLNQDSKGSGDSIAVFTRQLKGMLQSLNISQSLGFTKS